jgi:gluconate 2-dehydrogenase gamma chain
MPHQTRRGLLATTAVALALPRLGAARTIAGETPWSPNQAYPPGEATSGPWQFFNPDEAAVVEAIADRLIPSDDLGAGGKDAGCAVFIDRQLMTPYGGYEWLYMKGPFVPNAPGNFGLQSPVTPRERYRSSLAALADYTRAQFAGKLFHELPPADQDHVLTGLEKGDIKLADGSGRALFNLVHANVVEGYFADPIYGGNRDMVGWKLVGFPGVRYDYRDVIANPNQPYTLPPVSLLGRQEASR